MGYQDDQTRKILDLIREGKLTNDKGIITEQEFGLDTLDPTDQMTPEEEEFETADVDDTEDQSIESKDLEGDELKEEIDKFKQTVYPRVEFNTFKLYPNSQNVEWSGKFTDSRIEWSYSLDDSRGVYMSAELVQLRDETLEVIKKLVAYYKSWSDDWALRIAEEYKPETTEEEESGFEPGDDLPEEEF